jgi:hypothetical protein
MNNKQTNKKNFERSQTSNRDGQQLYNKHVNKYKTCGTC